MTSITHIFTADRHHLVPNMVKYIDLNINNFNHLFVLIGSRQENKEIYNFDQVKSKILLLKSIKEINVLNLSQNGQQVILHGVPYSWMIHCMRLKIKNLSWVCWGAGAKLNFKNYKSLLLHPLKILIYNRFKRIAVLMDQDAQDLNKYFFIQNTYFVAYPMEVGATFPYNELKLITDPINPNIIYIGNNSACINSYIDTVEHLKKFKHLDRIECMLNYSFKENHESTILRQLGNRNFGEKFIMNTEFYNLKEYYKYMNKCSIYICAVDKQTGLGAIYTTLRLGKKVFLKGKNYEWITSLGCKIFHVDKLKSISEKEFLSDISEEDKIKNYNIIENHLDQTKIDEKWNDFLRA